MATVFQTTLKPILIMCKCLGLLDISYTLKSTGSTVHVQKTDSTYHSVLEITRMFVLLIFTYAMRKKGLSYINIFRILKFWVFISLARVSQLKMIKLINGFIKYDRKLTYLTSKTHVRQRTPSKMFWYIIIVSLSLYYVTFIACYVILWPPKDIDMAIIALYFYSLPSTTDFAIVMSACFYLSNVTCRFQTLNNAWARGLPAELLMQITTSQPSDIVQLVETIMSLHAELSRLLCMFNLSYGPLLLAFFAFNFIDTIYIMFLIISYNFSLSGASFAENVLRNMPPYVLIVQNIIFMASIIVVSSWAKEKKMKILSYLRLIRISKLPNVIKLQIKLFMHQISISGLDEISAFGIFDINLNLVITIIILLMTGLSTLIQMKRHTIINTMVNSTKSFHKHWKNVQSATNHSGKYLSTTKN